MTIKEGICGFENDEVRWLSNFYMSSVRYLGITYPSSEHAYQAQKTLDLVERQQIATLKTPGQAKRAGKAVKMRSDWEQVKDQIMEDIVRIKFQSNPVLMAKLLSTGDLYLEETNTWNDTYWGVCKGRGQNKLGKILMKVRDQL